MSFIVVQLYVQLKFYYSRRSYRILGDNLQSSILLFWATQISGCTLLPKQRVHILSAGDGSKNSAGHHPVQRVWVTYSLLHQAQQWLL